MLKLKNKKGMSLIELIVVIGIIGIMATVSIVSLTKARNETAVEGELDKLVAVIREAQNYALTGKQASSECYKYQVSTVSPKVYKLGNSPGPGCTINSSFNLENGVKFKETSNLTFENPHATTAGGSFSLKRGEYECSVVVNSVGLVTKNCSY
jgi:prepilin-type N-terminal cleavage/methylation domain-containing protein